MKWEDQIDVSRPDPVTWKDQECMGLVSRRPANFVLPEAERRQILPVQTPANDALGQLVGGLMAEARTVHLADPLTRGKAIFGKTLGFSVFLWGLTIAALALSDTLEFMIWLLWASIEGGIVFLVIAYLDWREHPSAIRWQWTQGLLGMMETEQRARLRAQYGEDWDK